MKIAVQLTNYEYDYWQDIGYAIQDILHMNNRQKYICSELVDIFLNKIGWLNDGTSLGDKTPNELYREVKDIPFHTWRKRRNGCLA